MNNPIHIVCNIDASYIQHCIVMFTSLCENNKDLTIVIHIISDKLTFSAENELKKLSKKYQITLNFYYPMQSILQHCPKPCSNHISYASYYRCFISSILPEDIHKVLYLDCDIIIRDNIRELWNTDISNYAIGCVEDMWSLNADNYIRLKYPNQYSYFNAGVLLINLSYWRKHDIHQKVNEYLLNNNCDLLFNDQDVLNALFYDKKLFIPFKWNMQDGFFRRKRKIAKTTWPELDEAIKSPIILHYTGGIKPWHYKSLHPYKSEYFKYLDMTPWANWRPKVDYKFIIINILTNIFNYRDLIKHRYRKIKK